MSKLVPFIIIATAKSFSSQISARRIFGIFMLIAALAFSGCAMNDHYSPISGPGTSQGGFGGGGG